MGLKAARMARRGLAIAVLGKPRPIGIPRAVLSKSRKNSRGRPSSSMMP